MWTFTGNFLSRKVVHITIFNYQIWNRISSVIWRPYGNEGQCRSFSIRKYSIHRQHQIPTKKYLSWTMSVKATKYRKEVLLWGLYEVDNFVIERGTHYKLLVFRWKMWQKLKMQKYLTSVGTLLWDP